MQRGARQMEVGVVGRHLGSICDEEITVSVSSAADAEAPGSVARPFSGRTAERAGDEDLAATRVDDREGVLGSCSEGREGGDARDREVESESEAAGDREPDPRAGEAPGPGSDDDRREVGGRQT